MPYAHIFYVIASNVHYLIIHGGYIILFLFTVLEGIPLVGMFVPGHIAILFAGFLSKIGSLDVTYVILVSIVGAIIGDYIGFMIGRKWGMSFIDKFRPYFFITDEHIEKAKSLLSKHTGKALIMGRFTPATRALMPFVVGMSNTPVKKFWIFNIIGGVSWTVSSVAIGYIFGSGYHAAAGFFGKFMVLAILTSIVIIWGYKFVNTRFHIFRKFELFTLALNILSLWGLAKMIQDTISMTPFMIRFDVSVSNWIDMYNHGTFLGDIIGMLGKWITTIGSTEVTAGIGILIAIVLAFKKKWRSSAIMLLSISVVSVMIGFLKELFMRTRPENALEIILNDPSFPSGHAGLAAALFVVIAYLFAPKIHSWINRELFIVFCALAAFAIGLSRVILNVHWASDVIAGWALGVFVATSSILLVRYISFLVVKKD